MPFLIDWQTEYENGMSVRESIDSPLQGISSLRFFTDETLFTDEEFRKSGSVCLRESRYPTKGFSNGRIRTLIRRSSTDQATGWSGIYCMCDRENIGTRLDPAENMYQVTDKDGSIRILKTVNSITTQVASLGSNIPLNATRAFEVEWNLSANSARLSIIVRLGTVLDFSGMTLVGAYTDTAPLLVAVSEGLFAQTTEGTDTVDYRYDATKVIRYRLL